MPVAFREPRDGPTPPAVFAVSPARLKQAMDGNGHFEIK